MNNRQAIRWVELLHGSILLAFICFVPLCFSSFPTEGKANEHGRSAAPATFPEVCEEGGDGGTLITPQIPTFFPFETMTAAKKGDDIGAKDELENCYSWASSVLVLPVVVALAGASVFSMEEFEAFPLL
eukprot:TRINITY_DN44406_c0_g1_i1.p1 TRINITY_DN44406_c0_g1~~TRINITY_DN44406_c0_g1_i1.p1  ORF type:complete len:129 (+),score=14.32 TRINITY_DN44406_c0_g1_i1:49-435(+)